jgi:2-phosphosulfolactate phosphatase
MVQVNVSIFMREALNAIRREDVIIVVDVLRCSSTIITALANGAREVVPVKTVQEARRLFREDANRILAGERGGVKPLGFKLGNSPREFSPEKVRGKSIILTTTNGTKAIALAKKAKLTLIGAFLNAGAVAKAAFKRAEGAGISIVTAGTKGKFSLEDFICAGLIVGNFPKGEVELNDAAYASTLAWREASKKLNQVVRNGYHAKYLERISLGEDIDFCLSVDLYDVVPYCKGDKVIKLKL